MSYLVLILDAIAYRNAFFGEGEGPVFLDNLGCTGNEQSIVNCSASRNTAFENHNKDSGVKCFDLTGREL